MTIQDPDCPHCNPVDGAESLGLFDVDRFVMRGDCGAWDPFMEWLYITSNHVITVDYVVIGVILLYCGVRERRHALDKRNMSVLPRAGLDVMFAFGAFVLSCGIGHAEGYLAFRWPNYHAFAVAHAVTAIASTWAVWVTFRHRHRLISAF